MITINEDISNKASQFHKRAMEAKKVYDFISKHPNLANAGIGAGSGIIGGAALAGGAMLASQALLPGESSGQVGEIGSNPGLMGVKTPYVILKRNKDYTPSNLGHMYGEPSNEYVKLANCHGYTKVKDVHIEISCTQDERAEIESLLKQGVIL